MHGGDYLLHDLIHFGTKWKKPAQFRASQSLRVGSVFKCFVHVYYFYVINTLCNVISVRQFRTVQNIKVCQMYVYEYY